MTVLCCGAVVVVGVIRLICYCTSALMLGLPASRQAPDHHCVHYSQPVTAAAVMSLRLAADLSGWVPSAEIGTPGVEYACRGECLIMSQRDV